MKNTIVLCTAIPILVPKCLYLIKRLILLTIIHQHLPTVYIITLLNSLDCNILAYVICNHFILFLEI